MQNQMLIRPRLSEKAYGVSEQTNTFVMEVPGDANKLTIAHAVEAQFKVTVTSVNIVNVKGKTKRTAHRRTRPVMGKRSDVKKAYVTLKQGDKLPFFAEPEAENDKSKKGSK